MVSMIAIVIAIVTLMAHVVQPPEPFEHLEGKTLFLAGSIEMGTAERWQQSVISALVEQDAVILNPRRDEWDASWEQRIDNPVFREQVEWELSGLERADVIALYLAPQTKSPISLLELGLHARQDKLVVCCPEGFWRKGNVDIVCARYGIETAASLQELTAAVRRKL